ncbi:hypothetical protein [uncultured Victivallis sp.]|uniref:hypothetical protein n=1 Tax=uncultured Victivallis sp. TaxID=354118 RepID=UPI0025D69267|nr:hypothetical protein [uncultured Victivallis sp.]
MTGKRFAAGLFALLLGAVAGAAEAVPPPAPQTDELAPPPPPPGKPDRKERGFGPFVWRAFSRLTEQQRLEMLKLQSSDPEQFRQKMRELGEALRKEDMARFAELRKAVESYRASKDEAERAVLKKTITEHVREDYMERLEDNKRQLEEMKRRTKFLEGELAKREANADQIIKVRVESILKGELPEPGKHPPKRKP